MVKKLFKHEILSYLRIWIPIQIVLLVVSLMGRIAWIFEPESDVYKVLFGMAVAIYVMNIISSFFIMYIFSIVRFYKNMFSHEGYLTLTLPVTSSQHIWVKSLSALLFTVLSVITVFVSFAIFSSGDPFVEIMKALGYLIKIECIDRGALYVMAIIILSAINMLVRIFSGFVLVYAFIAIGRGREKTKSLYLFWRT